VRLTYDHKGSDKQEAKRITDAGGFVMSGRVNGVLAVTRSLGDSSMKEYVVGSPYTTETELGSEDEFLILACDGVSSPVGCLCFKVFIVVRPCSFGISRAIRGQSTSCDIFRMHK
jgi:serine/threonine protein phosphatase PrpC